MAEASAKSESILAQAESAPPDELKSKVLSEINFEAFEGPEKLLEVWFVNPRDIQIKKDAKTNEDSTVKTNGTHGDLKDGKVNNKRLLRSVDRQRWEDALNLVRCKILSVIQNDHFDSYLLSESSLFVWPQKVILKTCGTTTLLLALPAILQIAKDVGLTYIGDVFYSRRNYFFQAKQLAPHSSFDDEVKFLDGTFEGSAYVLGKKKMETIGIYILPIKMSILTILHRFLLQADDYLRSKFRNLHLQMNLILH